MTPPEIETNAVMLKKTAMSTTWDGAVSDCEAHCFGQIEEVDHRARTDGGNDPKVENAGEEPEHTGEETKRLAVPDLEELRESHGARLVMARVSRKR